MKKLILLSGLIVVVFSLLSFKKDTAISNTENHLQTSDTILFEGEKHFTNVQQLTFGGDNAEAYFSFDGKYIIFQKTNPKEGIQCDQIWLGKVPNMPGEKFEPKLVSTGTGRTTCAYFYPDGKHILYASTHLGSTEPERSGAFFMRSFCSPSWMDGPKSCAVG